MGFWTGLGGDNPRVSIDLRYCDLRIVELAGASCLYPSGSVTLLYFRHQHKWNPRLQLNASKYALLVVCNPTIM